MTEKNAQLGVSFLDLDAHYAPILPKIREAMERVIAHHQFIMGPEVGSLEAKAAACCGTAHAIAVSSGTDALLVALMALGVEPGDEVIAPTYSFFATAGVIARLGAKPVFVDILPDTFNIDPAAVERAMTKKTKAIIPVHLFGRCADIDTISRIAKARGVRVLEDAAQSLGAEFSRGRKSGSVGDLGATSFFPTKNLGAMGDAGMVFANDEALAARVRLLRVHGSKDRYYHEEVGGNFRLDTLQAAVLEVKLPLLDSWAEGRRRAARRYEGLFRESGALEKAGIVLPASPPSGEEKQHVYNQFVIRTPRRDVLRSHLASQGIQTQVYYPLPLHLQPCFQALGHKKGDFPVAEKASEETLALPIYPEIDEAKQSIVVRAIAKFFA